MNITENTDGQLMHTRNSSQALPKRLVRRVTAPGNLLGRKSISVEDKFVPTHAHTHTYTSYCIPYAYRLLQSAHILSTAFCKYVQSVHTKNRTMLTTTKFPSTTL